MPLAAGRSLGGLSPVKSTVNPQDAKREKEPQEEIQVQEHSIGLG
jgi:hypothetical protein